MSITPYLYTTFKTFVVLDQTESPPFWKCVGTTGIGTVCRRPQRAIIFFKYLKLDWNIKDELAAGSGPIIH